jgi:hypothetical protein
MVFDWRRVDLELFLSGFFGHNCKTIERTDDAVLEVHPAHIYAGYKSSMEETLQLPIGM